MRSFHAIRRLIKFLLDLYSYFFALCFIVGAFKWFWRLNRTWKVVIILSAIFFGILGNLFFV